MWLAEGKSETSFNQAWPYIKAMLLEQRIEQEVAAQRARRPGMYEI